MKSIPLYAHSKYIHLIQNNRIFRRMRRCLFCYWFHHLSISMPNKSKNKYEKICTRFYVSIMMRKTFWKCGNKYITYVLNEMMILFRLHLLFQWIAAKKNNKKCIYCGFLFIKINKICITKQQIQSNEITETIFARFNHK